MAAVPPLFVYGTLRRGSRHPMAARLRREAVWLRPAGVRGWIWAVARYPGLTPGGARRVRGDLFRLQSAASLGWLHAYEGCGPVDPPPHPYARRRTAVRWRGRTAVAATYVCLAPVRGCVRIATGD